MSTTGSRRHRDSAEAGSLSYGGQRLLDMAAGTRDQAARPAARRAARRASPPPSASASAALIKKISRDIPVLLVEHDIDRVFQLADHVTVMNDGQVLVDGTRRGRALVAEGAGGLHRLRRSHALAGKARADRGEASAAAARSTGVDTFYGKSHILQRRVVRRARERDRRAARPQRRRQVDRCSRRSIGIAPPRTRRDHARRRRARRPAVGRASPGAASPMCRRAAACSPA